MFNFLREIKVFYEIIIYSRLLPEILQPLIGFIISKEGKIFSFILDQTNCFKCNGILFKSLPILSKQRDPLNILFIDSKYQEHAYHTSNYLPIIPYFGAGSLDNELIKLKKLIIKLSAKDVLEPLIRTGLETLLH